MESVGSNSSSTRRPPSHSGRFRSTHFSFADRMVRALHHHLRLLHRSDSDFFVLGATGNVYVVTLTSNPSCTCPDRATPCKHILFVFIRVLGVSLDDSCLRRRTLRACQLSRLLGLPTLPESVAAPGLRQRFHQLFFGQAVSAAVEMEEGTNCPVCLEEMGKTKAERVVACRTCRNPVHVECFRKWKRRSPSCVICRAIWRDSTTSSSSDPYNYLNLSAYIDHTSPTADCTGGG